MIKKKFFFLIIIFVALSYFQSSYAVEYKLYGFIQPEYTQFLNGDGAHGQKNKNSSIFAQGNYIAYLNDGNSKFSLRANARLDENDTKLNYFDFQKLKYEYYFEDTTIKIGIDKIYWGVNESFKIVDIINQSNIAEDITGTEKFGQPMISITQVYNFGVFDFYILPYSRERVFPGSKGRPRLAYEIDYNSTSYESSLKENKIGGALRFSKVIDDFDLGLTHYFGTARNPELNINPSSLKLEPYYPILSQTGIDIQATIGSCLYKLEAVTVDKNSERHTSFAGGVEYTFYQINNSSADLGLITEIILDDRNDYFLNNETAIGLRLTLNDINGTSLLTGASLDNNGESNRFFSEFETRLSDDSKLFIDIAINGHINKNDFTYAFKQDSSLSLKFAKYF